MFESKNVDREFSNKPKEPSKRTTIILKKADREFIDSLIKEGKESGIKSMISKMLDIYKKLKISNWRFPGEYYYGISRVAFVNLEFINILIQNIPVENWREIGIKMGETSKIVVEILLGVQTLVRETWQDALDLLTVQGFGIFSLKDNFLLIRNPFIGTPNVLAGFLEGLLAVTPPFIFKIVEF